MKNKNLFVIPVLIATTALHTPETLDGGCADARSYCSEATPHYNLLHPEHSEHTDSLRVRYLMTIDSSAASIVLVHTFSL